MAVCPFGSHEEFLKTAQPLTIKVNDQVVAVVNPKDFRNTGGMGWHAATKIPLVVGEKAVMTQANFLLAVIGSKDLPDSAGIAQAKKEADALAKEAAKAAKKNK
ncbi:MAG: hypothetical protein HY376_00590 [Candidatus Blackburnbacteria bacterium]|nr:hypothetical protein [Candidatus Blackburnbacteria bacterium]